MAVAGSWAELPGTRNVGSSSRCSGVRDELDTGGKQWIPGDPGAVGFGAAGSASWESPWDMGMWDDALGGSSLLCCFYSLIFFSPKPQFRDLSLMGFGMRGALGSLPTGIIP